MDSNIRIIGIDGTIQEWNWDETGKAAAALLRTLCNLPGHTAVEAEKAAAEAEYTSGVRKLSKPSRWLRMLGTSLRSE